MDTKAIKKMVLQKTGLKTSEISITGDYSSINVKIKAFFPRSIVENLLSRFEKIDRCQASGEILSGCNTYVFVDYDREKEIAIPEELKNIVKAAAGNIVLKEYPKCTKIPNISRFDHEWIFRTIWENVAKIYGNYWTNRDLSGLFGANYSFFTELTINN